MRKLLLPAALVAVALLASACDANVASNAATVDGTAISQSSLASTLSGVAGNSVYACELSSAGTLTISGSGTKVTGAGQSSYRSSFVAAVLTEMIELDAVRADLARRHQSPGPFASKEAELQLIDELTPQSSSSGASGAPTCQGSGAAALAGFPDSYRSELIELQADLDVLAASKVGFRLTAAGVDAYATAHGGIPKERYLSVILVQSKGTAQTIAAAIARGSSFSSEARAHSLTAASTGGALGAIPDAADATGLPAPLSTEVPAAKVGVVKGPASISLSGSTYWILFEVTKVSVVPPADVAAQYLPTLAQGESALGSKVLAGARVTVTPAYGSWKDENGVYQVVPTSGPAASLLPNPSAVGASGSSVLG